MSRLQTRRNALKVSVAGFAVAALAACKSTSLTGNIPQQVVTYAADVANGLVSFAKNAVSLPNASVIAGYAADAATAANALNTSLAMTAGQSIITQISSDVAAVVNAIQGMQISAQASAILQDVVLALQILLPLVGLLAPTMPAVPAVREEPGFRGAPAKTPDPAAALAILHTLPTATINGVQVNR